MVNPVSDDLRGIVLEHKLQHLSEAAALTHFMLKIQPLSLLKKIGIEEYESGEFEAGYKWKLVLYPDGNKSRNVEDHLSLYLVSADVGHLLHLGWYVNTIFWIFLLDQCKDNYLIVHGVNPETTKAAIVVVLTSKISASSLGQLRSKKQS
ncbi:hypothetical protein DITRI_Ditri19aG0191600 [Diplodiscus trichospermus]